MARPEPKYNGDPIPEAYDAGYQAFFDKKREQDNPHQPSGHERDMTLEDECQAAWYSGFWDAQEDKNDTFNS